MTRLITWPRKLLVAEHGDVREVIEAAQAHAEALRAKARACFHVSLTEDARESATRMVERADNIDQAIARLRGQ